VRHRAKLSVAQREGAGAHWASVLAGLVEWRERGVWPRPAGRKREREGEILSLFFLEFFQSIFKGF